MNSLYHKVAVASVGIALGFALGTPKQAKAATFTFTPTSINVLMDRNLDGLPDWGYTGGAFTVGMNYSWGPPGSSSSKEEHRAFYEFNIASLPFDSNTVIESAILESRASIEWYAPYFRLQAHGYTENEKVYPPGIYNAGKYLDRESIGSILYREPKGIATFNVLPFINERIRNNDSFAGFRISFLDEVPYTDEEGFAYLDKRATLTITTETVPEPTTIFGSALALGVGGWLKRKKSSQRNKTAPQS